MMAIFSSDCPSQAVIPAFGSYHPLCVWRARRLSGTISSLTLVGSSMYCYQLVQMQSEGLCPASSHYGSPIPACWVSWCYLRSLASPMMDWAQIRQNIRLLYPTGRNSSFFLFVFILKIIDNKLEYLDKIPEFRSRWCKIDLGKKIGGQGKTEKVWILDRVAVEISDATCNII